MAFVSLRKSEQSVRDREMLQKQASAPKPEVTLFYNLILEVSTQGNQEEDNQLGPPSWSLAIIICEGKRGGNQEPVRRVFRSRCRSDSHERREGRMK